MFFGAFRERGCHFVPFFVADSYFLRVRRFRGGRLLAFCCRRRFFFFFFRLLRRLRRRHFRRFVASLRRRRLLQVREKLFQALNLVLQSAGDWRHRLITPFLLVGHDISPFFWTRRVNILVSKRARFLLPL